MRKDYLKRWMTVNDIIASKFKGIPHSKEGILLFAQHNGWFKDGKFRCTDYGVLQFHCSNIPASAIDGSIAKKVERQAAKLIEEIERIIAKNDDFALAAYDKLPPRRRAIAEARFKIVSEITLMLSSDVGTLSRCINELREKLLDGRAPAELVSLAKAASERDKVPSRTTLYQWYNSFAEEGITALAPHDKRPSASEHERALRDAEAAKDRSPFDRIAQRRVSRCSALLANLTPAECAEVLDMNAAAIRDYARQRSWKLD